MTVWEQLLGQPRAQKILHAAAVAGRLSLEASSTSADVEGSTVPAAEAEAAALTESALAHSWLVTGPPGAGRSVAGRVLAAALQCTGEPVGCGECPGCRTVMTGSHPDVRVVATDKLLLSIDETRDLIPWAQTMPNLGRWRIVIVEDADRMAERTTNVLLKSIEEPPEHTIWVLCAPTPADMLPTIRSRCRSLHLRTPSVESVADHLVRELGADPHAATQAAIVSQCHVGIAKALIQHPELRQERRRLFGTLLVPRTVGDAVLAAGRLVAEAKETAKAETEQRNAAERADLMRTLGLEAGARVPPALRSQVKALEEEQDRRAKRALHDVLDRVMLDLLSFYRDVLVLQLGAEAHFINADMVDEIKQIATNSLQSETLLRVGALEVARKRLSSGGNPQIVFDALAAALVDPAAIPATLPAGASTR